MNSIAKYQIIQGNTSATYNFEDSFLQDGIAEVKAYLNYYDSEVLGLEADYENNTFTRLAGAAGKTAGNDFNSIAPWSGMTRCTVADNGTVVALYGEEGYTQEGTTGQCMVRIPKFYYKVVPLKLEPITEMVSDETVTYDGYHLLKARYYISATPNIGFKLHPLFINESGEEVDYVYISAFEGSLYDTSENAYVLEDDLSSVTVAEDKLCSVAIPHTKTFTIDGVETEVLLHGVKPSTYIKRPDYETLAKNRGTGWHSFNTRVQSAVNMLFAVEYASFNWQENIGFGVVSLPASTNINYSSYTGSTIGNTTGSAVSTIAYNGVAQTATNKKSISYRGIENFFGNIWKFMIDMNVWGNGSKRGGECYLCNDYNFAESKRTDNYEGIGFSVPNVDDYIKYFGYGNSNMDWVFVTSKSGGTSFLPVGDYSYNLENLNSYRISLLGGGWMNGYYAGGLYMSSFYPVDAQYRSIGSRIIYIPQTSE